MTPEEFVSRAMFTWHQRFELAPGVFTPGDNDVAAMLDRGGVPARLDGVRVLDVGTTNGGAAFLCERRGASEVLAVDVCDPDLYGFRDVARVVGSTRTTFLQTSVYELPSRVVEPFGIVLFLGVLYHLRHPLLALDALRDLTAPGGVVVVETAVCDARVAGVGGSGLVEFYRRDELLGDSSNWFAPTVATLVDWCASSGFDVEVTDVDPPPPAGAPSRVTLRATRSESMPEYRRLSYEVPLRVEVAGRSRRWDATFFGPP